MSNKKNNAVTEIVVTLIIYASLLGVAYKFRENGIVLFVVSTVILWAAYHDFKVMFFNDEENKDNERE